MIKHIHDAGLKVAALCGSPSQARKHADAGVDIIIAQGGEAGGHWARWAQLCCGRRSSRRSRRYPCSARVVSVAVSRSPRPWRWAAGCVVRLAVVDGRGILEHPGPASRVREGGSRDTVRSRSFTGKPARMLRNDWTEAWEAPDNPKPLGMPLQYMVSGMAVRATNRYPNESVDVAFNPVGQVVGQFSRVEKTSTVIERWVQEYLEATNKLDELNEAAAV